MQPPAHLKRPLKSYVQLTSEKRYVIYHLKLFKRSLREIAHRLGCHHTTISREIQRNGPEPNKSRYLIAAKLANKAAAVRAAAIPAAFRRTPRTLRRMLTLDNGKEFARFSDIEKGTGLAIYFTDPYSVWQRGTNENTNGFCEDISKKAQTSEMLPRKRVHPP